MCIRDSKRPLQPPYEGPFPVLEAGDKFFKILRHGLPYTVSIDRLKPCFTASPPPSSIIPTRTPPPMHPRPDCPRASNNSPALADTNLPRLPLSVEDSPGPGSNPRAKPFRPPPAPPPESSSASLSSSSSPSALPGVRRPSEAEKANANAPPVYTSSGRLSKPRMLLNL